MYSLFGHYLNIQHPNMTSSNTIVDGTNIAATIE